MQQQNNNNGVTLDDLAIMIKSGFDDVDKRFEKIEQEMTSVKALMVTKDYLDDKLADLRGDILTVIRREDTRLTTLVDILHTKKILDEGDVNMLQRLQPLVQIPL